MAGPHAPGRDGSRCWARWADRFEVDPRTRHVLLIAGGLGMAGVRALADEALAAGRQVALLFGAARAAEVYPSSLLPDEVEYVVATDDGSLGHHGLVTELVPDYEAWADQAFACGPLPMLAALARLAAGRDARLGVARLGRKGRRYARRAARHARRRAARRGSRSHGAEHGLRGRRLPGLRGDRGRRAAARLPGGPGLRRRRDRLGAGWREARKKFVTGQGRGPRPGIGGSPGRSAAPRARRPAAALGPAPSGSRASPVTRA